MPRETEKHSLPMSGGKQIGGQRPGGRNQHGRGTTRSGDFLVSGFRTHVVATTVCATEVSTHSVSHAHYSDTISLRGVQTSRTRMAQGVCGAHVIPRHLTFSLHMFHPPSLLFPHGAPRHFVPVCTFLAELFPIRQRGSSALPRERRGVWLPGRSDALHNSIFEHQATGAEW